jgi:hypothetical protein
VAAGVQSIIDQTVVMEWPFAAHGNDAGVRLDFQAPGASGMGALEARRGRAMEIFPAAMVCNMRKRVGPASAWVMLITDS